MEPITHDLTWHIVALIYLAVVIGASLWSIYKHDHGSLPVVREGEVVTLVNDRGQPVGAPLRIIRIDRRGDHVAIYPQWVPVPSTTEEL